MRVVPCDVFRSGFPVIELGMNVASDRPMPSKQFKLQNPAGTESGRRRGKAKALLVACAVASVATASGCWPIVYGNPKGCRFDADAGEEVCDGWQEEEDAGIDGGETSDGGDLSDGGESSDGGADGGP